MTPFIIGIDIGSSGTKAIAMTAEGRILSTAYASYPTLSSGPEVQELDPVALEEAVIQTAIESLAKAGGPGGLLGISFSCAMHSLIAVGNDGSALTHAITWADLRSKEFAAALKDTKEGKRIYDHTGTPIHAMSPLCKIIWIREKWPSVFSKTHKFISIKEFIWARFFGKYQVDHSIASATGLFDLKKLCWFPDALHIAGINASHLSEPVLPTHIEKAIDQKYQSRLGIPTGIAFIIGASDGCLANLGSGAMKSGDMGLTIGTSAAVRMITAASSPDPQRKLFHFILSGKWYVSGGAINNAGNVIKWWLDHFMEKSGAYPDDFGKILESISSIAPGSDGLIFLPYLFGERSPVWDAEAKAVFFGIHPKLGREHFLRSIVEGISYALYQVGTHLEQRAGNVKRIIASGGFIRSALWLQLVADLFNKEVCVTNAADASSIGAAMLGWHALGAFDDLADMERIVSVRDSYFPNENNHEAYMKNFSVFSVLYNQLKDDFQLMSRR